MDKVSLFKALTRIAGWVAIGALTIVGLPTENIKDFIGEVGINESEVVISTIALVVINSGFYFKDKLSKGQT